MAMKLYSYVAAALLGGALCVAGPAFAAKTTATHDTTVHHKAASTAVKHKATAKSTNAQLDSNERKTTADLNRASLAHVAPGQTSMNEQADMTQQAMLEEEEDLLLQQQAMLENDDGTAVD